MTVLKSCALTLIVFCDMNSSLVLELVRQCESRYVRLLLAPLHEIRRLSPQPRGRVVGVWPARGPRTAARVWVGDLDGVGEARECRIAHRLAVGDEQVVGTGR